MARLRSCGCPGRYHLRGCGTSERRVDFFRPAPPKPKVFITLTCLDCRGYKAVSHESEAKDAVCPRCRSVGRMVAVKTPRLYTGWGDETKS